LDDFSCRWAAGARYPFEKFSSAKNFYFPMANTLTQGDTLLEFGAGSCVNSLIIALLCPTVEVIATDLIEDHLLLAQQHIKGCFYIPANLHFMQLDIINNKLPSKLTAIMSDGVLEHFNNTQIDTVVDKIGYIKNIFISVPVNNAAIEYGDERIMPTWWWEKKIKKHLPHRSNVTTYFTSHNTHLFNIVRKIIPYQQITDQNSKFYNAYHFINKNIFQLEKKYASSALYHIS